MKNLNIQESLKNKASALKQTALLYSNKASTLKTRVVDFGKSSVQKFRTQVEKPFSLARELYEYQQARQLAYQKKKKFEALYKLEKIKRMKRVNSSQQLQEQYVDMMYRAPHEKRGFRRVTHFKTTYLENPYLWMPIVFTILLVLLASQDPEISDKLQEVQEDILAVLALVCGWARQLAAILNPANMRANLVGQSSDDDSN